MCFLKTGLKDGPSHGVSFYVCSQSASCGFVKKSEYELYFILRCNLILLLKNVKLFLCCAVLSSKDHDVRCKSNDFYHNLGATDQVDFINHPCIHIFSSAEKLKCPIHQSTVDLQSIFCSKKTNEKRLVTNLRLLNYKVNV